MKMMYRCLIGFFLIKIACGFFPLSSREEKSKINPRMKGCWFGDNFHEVGVSWHPNLGQPFGIMYCIRCNCVQDDFGRHSSPKVLCHDKRKSCTEKLNCKHPKIEPGECCASCPDDDSEDFDEAPNPDFESSSKSEKTFSNDDASTRSEHSISNSYQSKRFASLITNQQDSSRMLVARATFEMNGDNLRLTIHSTTPLSIHEISLSSILNDDVLLKKEIRNEEQGNNILCISWQKVSTSVTELLESQQLRLSVKINGIHDEVKPAANVKHQTKLVGKIFTHRALYAETFSGLLGSKTPDNSSLAAIFMITLGRNFKNINFVSLFKYSSTQGKSELKLKVDLILTKNEQIIRTSTFKSDHVEGEIADVWKSSSEILKAIGRGTVYLKLSVHLSEVKASEIVIESKITPRASCDVYRAVLSGSGCAKSSYNGEAGKASLTVNMDNTVNYNVQTDDIKADKKNVYLSGFYRRRKARVIENLTPHFKNGGTSGKLKALSAKELHIIQSNNAFVSIAEMSSCLLSGKLLKHEAYLRDESILLSGKLAKVQSAAAGQVWIEITNGCLLKYTLVVSGIEPADATSSLVGIEKDTGRKIVRDLARMETSLISEVLADLEPSLFNSINMGTAYLQVSTKKNPHGEIRGMIHVKNNCSSPHKRQQFEGESIKTKVAETSVKNSLYQTALTQQFSQTKTKNCYFDGKWHNNGAVWSPNYDKKCAQCVCKDSKPMCSPLHCPPVRCARPVATEDSCCPICEIESVIYNQKEQEPALFFAPQLINVQHTKLSAMKRGCKVETVTSSKHYSRGSRWNPSVHPFGVIKCVTCSCSNDDQIVCDKVICPVLKCRHPVSDPSQCCKRCPAERRKFPSLPLTRENWMLQDSPLVRTCYHQKETHFPGHTWKPKDQDGNTVRCVTCTCTANGENDTVSTKCTRTCIG